MARTRGGKVLMTGSLDEKAMLVRFSKGVWGARKKSVIATNKVVEDFEMANGAALVTKSLIAKKALATINSKFEWAYNWHIAHTLPWTDDGYRILSAAEYTEYMTMMRKLKADAWEALTLLKANWETFKEEQRVALGKLYDANDYPTDIENKYHFDIHIMPIPKKQDFRVTQIDDRDLAEIEKQIEDRFNTAETNAMKNLYGQVTELLTEAFEAFADPNAGFHDSKIDKLTDLMERLPRLNIGGDANLDRIRKVIETKICTLSGKELRKDINARKSAADDARKILAEMEEYC